MLDHEKLKHLANGTFENPVLSVYVRTDPRDPANASPPYAWEIELRNALREIEHQVDSGGERDHRLGFSELRANVERAIANLDPKVRGRSMIWFVDAAGTTIERLEGLHLPIRQTLAVWDARPFISPLVEWLDHGATTGIVAIGSEEVRVLQWSQGIVEEPADSSFELELGEWRQYGGPAPAVPGRAQHAHSQVEQYEARVDNHRHRLYGQAAHAVDQRAAELGWERIVLIAEGQYLHAFEEAMPEPLKRRVVHCLEHNASRDDAHAIELLLDPVLAELRTGRATDAVAEAQRRAKSGGAATLGPDETLVALSEGRVDHLVLDPAFDFSGVAAVFDQLPIEGPSALLAERAVEVATGTGAHVSAIDAEDAPALAEAGGMAALLRY